MGTADSHGFWHDVERVQYEDFRYHLDSQIEALEANITGDWFSKDMQDRWWQVFEEAQQFLGPAQAKKLTADPPISAQGLIDKLKAMGAVFDGKPEPKSEPKPYYNPNLRERNAWIYGLRNRKKPVTWPRIIELLGDKHPEWKQLGNAKAGRRALERHCDYLGVLVPRGRKGRPSNA